MRDDYKNHKSATRHEFTDQVKIDWRKRNILLWRKLFRQRDMRDHGFFVTLGGLCYHRGSIITNCEYDQIVLQERFCRPKQYVSIERDFTTHRRNTNIRGPTWIYGDFGKSFVDWYYNIQGHASFINADLMHGIDKSWDTIFRVLSVMHDCQRRGKVSLVIFNIVQRSILAENYGASFRDVYKTSKEITRYFSGLKLVEPPNSYQGSKVTTLTQLAFRYQR